MSYAPVAHLDEVGNALLKAAHTLLAGEGASALLIFPPGPLYRVELPTRRSMATGRRPNAHSPPPDPLSQEARQLPHPADTQVKQAPPACPPVFRPSDHRLVLPALLQRFRLSLKLVPARFCLSLLPPRLTALSVLELAIPYALLS